VETLTKLGLIGCRTAMENLKSQDVSGGRTFKEKSNT
jgi:hypothetical protein